MHRTLIRLLISGSLIAPVLFTGVVTGYQFATAEGRSESAFSFPNQPADDPADVTSTDSAIEESARVSAAPEEPTVALASASEQTEQVAAQSDDVEPATPISPALRDPLRTNREPASAPGPARSRGLFVRLSSDGFVPGRFQIPDAVGQTFTPAKRLVISFMQNGKVISRTRPGIDGVFQAHGIRPGYFTLVARGEDGMATFGVEVLAPDQGSRPADAFAEPGLNPAQSADAGLQIDSVLVPPRDVRIVNKLIETYGGPASPRSRSMRTASRAVTRADDTIRMVKDPQSDVSGNEPGSGDWGTPLHMPVFTRHLNGTVAGRLATPTAMIGLDGMRVRTPLYPASVFFVSDGALVQQGKADPAGHYAVAGLQAGSYSFVAVGPNGIAAFGVRVADSAPQASRSRSSAPFRKVSTAAYFAADSDGTSNDVGTDTGNKNDFDSSNDPGDGTQGNNAGAAGGGTAGGGGGGGGGGFGGGGLLGLAAGAALGAGIGAAIANNNDNQPASPSSF